MTTTPHAADERAKVCALLRSLAQEQDEVGHPFAAGVYRECADELERGGVSLLVDEMVLVLRGAS